MKRLMTLIISVLWLTIATSAFAQSTPIATPSTSLYPNLHSITVRFKQDIDKMKSDFASGTINQSQMASIRDQIKAVRILELSFLDQNGDSIDLTDAQTTQLNQMLDAINP